MPQNVYDFIPYNKPNMIVIRIAKNDIVPSD
jgi:hypothetical protein